MRHPESRIQRQILTYLRGVGFFPVHVPNGSKLAGSEQQRKRAGARLKLDGLYPGFPDLVVYGSGGRVGHIEVKAEGSYQQATQKDCEARLSDMGHRYAICRSVDDVVETLNEWGWL